MINYSEAITEFYSEDLKEDVVMIKVDRHDFNHTTMGILILC